MGAGCIVHCNKVSKTVKGNYLLLFAGVHWRGASNDGVVDNGVARQRTCCVRNKLAGSSDVGFGRDGRRCMSLRR